MQEQGPHRMYTPPQAPPPAATGDEEHHAQRYPANVPPSQYISSPRPPPDTLGNPQWHPPFHHSNPFDDTRIDQQRLDQQEQGDSFFYQRRVSQIPLAPDDRRRDSDATLADAGRPDPYKKYSLSSYEHPYDILPPQNAYNRSSLSQNYSPRRSARRSVSFVDHPGVLEYNPDEEVDVEAERAQKRRGIPSQMLQLRIMNQSNGDETGGYDYNDEYMRRPKYRRADSGMSDCSEVGLDPDDPRVTGARANHLEDQEDIEKNMLRQMDYRSRRKHLMRVKIEFNVTCVYSTFILPQKSSDFVKLWLIDRNF